LTPPEDLPPEEDRELELRAEPELRLELELRTEPELRDEELCDGREMLDLEDTAGRDEDRALADEFRGAEPIALLVERTGGGEL